MKLSICIHQFFERYLPRIKGVSSKTISAYRDTFTLFLPFAADYHSIKIESLKLEHLSTELILAFLGYLEEQRHNTPKTRNMRLATLKSFARMVRLIYPEERQMAERLLNLPQKRTQKTLIGFLTHEEMLKVFGTVNLKTKNGFRDYALLNLLYDSGARATEITTINIEDLDPQRKSLAILGKGNRYRLIELWPRTVDLINRYLAKYRTTPKPRYLSRLFINQRSEAFTRHGIYRLCKKYLSLALPPKRLEDLNPVHSFRHSCAVNLLLKGCSITDIRNHLGHELVQSSMGYLHLNLSHKRKILKEFVEYTQSSLSCDPQINELLDWENKQEILAWLDSL
jgi:integrase/recombinase XerD